MIYQYFTHIVSERFIIAKSLLYETCCLYNSPFWDNWLTGCDFDIIDYGLLSSFRYDNIQSIYMH